VVIFCSLKYLKLKLQLQLYFFAVGSAVLNLGYTEDRSVNLDEQIMTHLFWITCNEICFFFK